MQFEREPAAAENLRYDRVTIVLHWTTAILVVALYGLAQIWGFLHRGSAPRNELIALHVSLGLLLTAVLALRIVWRLTAGRRLPPAAQGMLELAAAAAHYGLYLLLAVQAVLGWCLSWALEEPLAFFSLFVIPSPVVFTTAQRQAILFLHDWIATIVIVLAGAHALAALFHRFVLRDGVLRRMLYG
jgi:cytochrome b561